jgi:hypothetical protein
MEPGAAAGGDDRLTLWRCVQTFPVVAAQASWGAMRAGVPFGGTLGWLMVVVMANDSGQYPWAPLAAAVFGWPVALLCDAVLLAPALVFRSWAQAYGEVPRDDAAAAAAGAN